MSKNTDPGSWGEHRAGDESRVGDDVSNTTSPESAPAWITYDPAKEKFGRSDVMLGGKRIGVVRRRGHLWDVLEPAMPWRTGFTSRSAAGDALARYYERQQRGAPR